MSGYFRMSDDGARRYLRARDGASPLSLDEVQQSVGERPETIVPAIDALREKLLALKQEFPDTLRQRDPQGGRFEQQGVEVVHQALELLPREPLSDPGFWTWMAVARFADIIEWRFGIEIGLARFANYGIGNPPENMLFRLWLRGEIGKDESLADPYELARVGDQDLWRSHIIRQGYGSAREVARSLLRLQAGKLSRDPLDVDSIRVLAKRLRRLHANVLFEVLDSSEADALVLEYCSDL